MYEHTGELQIKCLAEVIFLNGINFVFTNLLAESRVGKSEITSGK